MLGAGAGAVGDHVGGGDSQPGGAVGGGETQAGGAAGSSTRTVQTKPVKAKVAIAPSTSPVSPAAMSAPREKRRAGCDATLRAPVLSDVMRLSTVVGG
jgi:hypothetical protein